MSTIFLVFSMIEPKHVLLSLLIKNYMKIDTRTEVLLTSIEGQRKFCVGNDSFGDFVLDAWSNRAMGKGESKKSESETKKLIN